MKKSKLIINLIILFLLIILLEFSTYKKYIAINNITDQKYLPFKTAYTFLPIKYFEQYFKMINEHPEILNEIVNFRDPSITDSKKQPILLFGCSMTWGGYLEENEILSYKLSEITGRSVYNKALPGIGIQHTLYMLKHGVTKGIENPEVVMYVFIEDHIRRLFEECSYFENDIMYYKYGKNKKLKQVNDFDILYWHSYFIRAMRTIYINHFLKTKPEEANQFFLSHLLEVNNDVKKIYPNTRFIVFVFDGDNRIKALEPEILKNNIEIIYLSKLTPINFNEDKYLCEEDKQHPSALVWEVITPLLVKELKLSE